MARNEVARCPVCARQIECSQRPATHKKSVYVLQPTHTLPHARQPKSKLCAYAYIWCALLQCSQPAEAEPTWRRKDKYYHHTLSETLGLIHELSERPVLSLVVDRAPAPGRGGKGGGCCTRVCPGFDAVVDAGLAFGFGGGIGTGTFVFASRLRPELPRLDPEPKCTAPAPAPVALANRSASAAAAAAADGDAAQAEDEDEGTPGVSVKPMLLRPFARAGLSCR